MKNLYTIILTLLISAISIAQNGINYKALIKDANGDVVANQAVTIQFQILEDGITNVYQETHSPTTNANGIAIVNIGEGAVDSGDFSLINWGTAEHFLNVQVDTDDGAGLVDLGTTEFKSVPYAKMAEVAETVKNAPVSEFALVKARVSSSTYIEDFDLTNNFDPALGRFTVTKAGYYSIRADSTGNHQNNDDFFFFSITIRKNGTGIKTSEYRTRTSTTGGQNRIKIAVVTIEYLVPGDYIDITWLPNFGTQVLGTSLHIERIR